MNNQVERNHLEIRSRNELMAKNKPFDDLYLEKVDPPDFQLNKFFYKQIGKDYRWLDRLSWDDQNWINYVENFNIKTFILKDENNLIGYFYHGTEMLQTRRLREL